jgi:hypothetical protein
MAVNLHRIEPPPAEDVDNNGGAAPTVSVFPSLSSTTTQFALACSM